MKHLLIIFTLLLTSVSWSKDVEFKDLVKRESLYYEKFTAEPFTGNVVGDLLSIFNSFYTIFSCTGINTPHITRSRRLALPYSAKSFR